MSIQTEHIRRSNRQPSSPALQSERPVTQESQPCAYLQRALAEPSRLATADVLYLQRTIGNRAVAQLLPSRPTLQRTPASSVGTQGGAIDDAEATQIRAPQGSGQAVPEQVRRQVEQKTGADLSAVKVHNNTSSHALSRKLNARAFTHGNRIFLGKGESPHNVQLMAHELTHTIQQTGGNGKAQRTPLIQRFSDKDLEPGARTNWKQETVYSMEAATNTGVGRGTANTVFFLEDGSQNQLVVKAENNAHRKATQGQVMFGDKVLNELGINTPKSRIIEKSERDSIPYYCRRRNGRTEEFDELTEGRTEEFDELTEGGTEEFDELYDTILDKLVENKTYEPYDDDIKGDVSIDLNTARYFRVMALAKGKSMMSQTDNVNSLETTQEYLKQLSNKDFAYFRNIGKLVVADALLGNEDRFHVNLEHPSEYLVNGGNLFFDKDGEIDAIDTEMSIGDLNSIGEENGGALKTYTGELITPLFDKQGEEGVGEEMKKLEEKYLPKEMHSKESDKLGLFLQALLLNISKELLSKNNKDFAIQQHVTDWFKANNGAIGNAFRDGVQVGIKNVGNLMGNKERMKNLKGESMRYGGEPNLNKQMWSTFKARGRYMMDRAKGTDRKKALEKSYEYQGYKYGLGGSKPEKETQPPIQEPQQLEVNPQIEAPQQQPSKEQSFMEKLEENLSKNRQERPTPKDDWDPKLRQWFAKIRDKSTAFS